MKKGISVWSFQGMSLREIFEFAKKAGFEGVEVALDETGEVSMESTPEQLQAVKNMADEIGVELYSVATGLYWKYSLTDDDEAIREKAKSVVRKQLEVAKALGCDTILVVAGTVCADFVNPNKVVDYQDAYERSLAALNELKSYAEELQVHIGLENVGSRFLISPMEMKDFIEKIDSEYVGSYFDIGNVGQATYPEHWIKILAKYLKKVHIKDYRKLANGAGVGVDLLAGSINFPVVMKALENAGYDGWITAEMNLYRAHNDVMLYHTSHAMDKILGRN